MLVFELKESWNYSTKQHRFPKLDCLIEFENFNVGFKSSNINDSGSSIATNRPWDFHFPSNLENLCLLDFPLTSNSLSTIGRLPNLEELSLYDTIIHGEEWNMGKEDTFENLKFLNSEQVTLSNFGDIYSLKIITLVDSPQLEDSAMKIKEYAADMRGGDELHVIGRNNIPLFK
ncbi:hypothetical protein RDI58_007295 [Solanum bulbocastanum]|uniref:Uncharacterized protein n=1 Tax=Solanum bulbocastanum TaxID=147425 RepID=A0AAN8YIR3_SOLBU